VETDTFDSKLDEILTFVSNIEASINLKVASWKWSGTDITLQGQVTPEVCQVNTMGDNCLWNNKDSRIKLQLSGIYRIEVFVKFFTRERDKSFFLCFDDEPVFQHPAKNSSNSSSRQQEDSCDAPVKASDLEVCMTRYFNFEAGKSVSMYYSKKCQTVGSLSIHQV